MQRSGSLLNMFEPTCQWFVILNTIVLNFKRWTFIQKALQALSLFCIPWIENSVIFWIDLDVWDLTKFPPKKPNWQGAIYFVCCFFMFCFLTTAPYYSKFWICGISGRIDINTYLSMSMRRLYSVKTDIFQNSYFWCFFIRNNLSRTDLIIRVVSKFLSNL